MKKIKKNWFIFTLFTLFLGIFSFNCYSQVNIKLARIFCIVSEKYKIPSELLVAIAWQESKLNQYAVNLNGQSYFFTNKDKAITFLRRKKYKNYDVGLMQINSWWLRKLNIPLEDAFNPQYNLELGTLILKYCYNKYPYYFLSCYHTGRITTKGIKYQKKILQIINFLEK